MIEQILTQLRSRQIAEEQVETYSRQEKAAVKERELLGEKTAAEAQPRDPKMEAYRSEVRSGLLASLGRDGDGKKGI